jgi:predicted GNAT superfamily acetyltransferase
MQTKAHIKATNKWIKNTFDRITTLLPKGYKADLKALAASQGESLNTFVTQAIDERIERLKGSEDNGKE